MYKLKNKDKKRERKERKKDIKKEKRERVREDKNRVTWKVASIQKKLQILIWNIWFFALLQKFVEQPSISHGISLSQKNINQTTIYFFLFSLFLLFWFLLVVFLQNSKTYISLKQFLLSCHFELGRGWVRDTYIVCVWEREKMRKRGL